MNVNPAWSEEQRTHAWVIVSHARRNLNLSISPCIASSFVLLHNYFADPDHKNEELYILMVASLLLACKIEDTFRSMQSIFNELSKCILVISKHVSGEKIKSIFGDRDYSSSDLTLDEMKRVGDSELHLLNAIKWEMNIDLPFKHFNEAKPAFSILAHDEHLEDYFNFVLRDICLILKSDAYLAIPPCVTAAASIFHSFSGAQLPEQTILWINELKEQKPKEFAQVLQIFKEEGAKCVPICKTAS